MTGGSRWSCRILQGREAILKVHGQEGESWTHDVDFNAIARATSGASGAELANIINEAALRAVRMGTQRGQPERTWRRAWRWSSPVTRERMR